jgi:flavin reductase (DIM6/NTAB) family NADH-FMN oxidoreductase RutF
VSEDPHFVMFASGGRKDSQRNAEETGEFVCSFATYELREVMSRNFGSGRAGCRRDEAGRAHARALPLRRSPRVKESPVAFECRY